MHVVESDCNYLFTRVVKCRSLGEEFNVQRRKR